MKQQTHVYSRQIAMTHDRTVTWDCHEIAPNIQLITSPGCVPIVVETVAETLQYP